MAMGEGLERVVDVAVLNRHLDELVVVDLRLAPVREIAGEVPLRDRAGGFAGMAQIVVSQLLSVASANAIHGRFELALEDVTAERFMAHDETLIRQCGISGGKFRTMAGWLRLNFPACSIMSAWCTCPPKRRLPSWFNTKALADGPLKFICCFVWVMGTSSQRVIWYYKKWLAKPLAAKNALMKNKPAKLSKNGRLIAARLPDCCGVISRLYASERE